MNAPYDGEDKYSELDSRRGWEGMGIIGTE